MKRNRRMKKEKRNYCRRMRKGERKRRDKGREERLKRGKKWEDCKNNERTLECKKGKKQNNG